jgi:hypothetical protein
LKASLLHAVIEAPNEAPSFVSGLPPLPWPSHVRLSGQVGLDEVALVIAQLATYGRAPDPAFADLAGLADNFPVVLPGGLAAISGGIAIYPSCCCGLEGWREWDALLDEGSQPWLGHDPSPWVEVVEEGFVVWPDQGSSASPDKCIRFSEAGLRFAVVEASRDLREFLQPLRTWVAERAPALADRIVAEFSKNFVSPPGPGLQQTPPPSRDRRS